MGSFRLIGFSMTLAALSCAIFIASCEKPRDNPLDPGGTSYQPPSAVITQGPGEGQIVGSNTVVFQWSGNIEANLYRYRLSNYSVWSDWSTSKSATYDLLDDTTYTFTLQTKYLGQDEVTSYDRNFIVKAVQGPAIKFYKLKNIVAVNGQLDVQVWIVGVNNFFSARLTLVFDKSFLNLVSISGGGLITNNGFMQLILPDPTNKAVIQAANSAGTIDVSTAVLSQNGSTGETIGGTGEVLHLSFEAIRAGRCSISIAEQDVRDSSNSSIALPSPIQPDSVIVSP